MDKKQRDYPPIHQFRIWSEEDKKFYFSGGTPAMLSSFFTQTATLHTVHKMPYLRPVGIEDKNGKEIYEGDILRCNEFWTRSIVTWIGLGWTIVEGNGCTTDFPVYEWKGFEVIGNIFEDRHLLDK